MAAEAVGPAPLTAVDELRWLLAKEAEHRTASFQRLERRVEQLRGEGQAAAAEGNDALRVEKQRLERVQAEMVWMGSALQGIREQLGMTSGSGSPSTCDAQQWWEMAAQRVSSLDERQSVIDDRLKALRVEFREMVAQEAEQRVEGLQRLERAQLVLSQGKEARCSTQQLEYLQLQQRQAEMVSKASLQELHGRLSKAEAALKDPPLRERLAKLEEQAKAQTRLAEAMQARVEELARAHNSVARAARDAQPEAERRAAALDAAVGALRGKLEERLQRLEERLQTQARLAEEKQLCIEELARSQQSACLAAQAEAEVEKRFATLDRAVATLRAGFEENFAGLEEQVKAQARTAEATQTRLEDLARAHNSVARAARDGQPDLERRLSAVSTSVIELQSEVTKDREVVTGLERQLSQWEQRFEAFGARMDLRWKSLRGEADRADTECRHESQKRRDTENLLVSLLGELDNIRMQIDHRSGSDSGSVANRGLPPRYALERPLQLRETCAGALAAGGDGNGVMEALLPEADLGAPYLQVGFEEDPTLNLPRPSSPPSRPSHAALCELPGTTYAASYGGPL